MVIVSSAHAGGFLALDWNDASRLGPLARLSYQLHAGLEAELGIALDYRHAFHAHHCRLTVYFLCLTACM